MSWIGGSSGIFKLRESDDWCGSLISVEDAAEILAITTTHLAGVAQRHISGTNYLVENDLHKAWSQGKIVGSPYKPKVGNATVSFDEIILKRLIEITLPGAQVIQQAPFARKHVDLRIEWRGEIRLVEFTGPSHFIFGQYQRDPVSPLLRKRAVEDALGAECVIWPFWIQRCSINVRALFEKNIQGRAAVWSTKAFFGDFAYPDSAAIITTLNERFGAFRENGIGYMYGNSETVNKPVHPIVEKVRTGKVQRERLVPRGTVETENWWLP